MATSASTSPGAERDAGAVHRVVIVDDHELLRTGTRQILEDAAGFEVVGEAADAEDALAVVAASRPDVALVDIRLPGINGIQLAGRIASEHPSVRVLVLSAYDDADYVRAALAVGVSGYLLKTTPSAELVSAIRTACGGTTVLDPAVSARLAEQAPSDSPEALAALTTRERDVVRLAARGLANKAIAQELGISPRTVEGHLNHIFEKVGATSRTALVHLALTTGLLAEDERA